MAFVIRRTDFIILGEGTLVFDFKGLSAYRHYFVGLAYVHNLMNGEGVPASVEPGKFSGG
jgi:hypothetical protein